MNETAAAIGAQLEGGPTEVPHGVLEIGAGIRCSCGGRCPGPFGETPTVQADDGGQEVGVP